MKSGNLNFLEHSGPLQACDGTALPFTFILTRRRSKQWDSIPGRDRKFVSSPKCLHRFWDTQRAIQWVQRALSPALTLPWREAHLPAPPSAQVKNKWSYTTTTAPSTGCTRAITFTIYKIHRKYNMDWYFVGYLTTIYTLHIFTSVLLDKMIVTRGEI
jgi:hypothetical protein